MTNFEPAARQVVPDDPASSTRLGASPAITPERATPSSTRALHGDGSTPRFAPLAATRIHRSSDRVIRRAIDDATWRRRVQPMLRQGRPVSVRGNGAEKSMFLDGKKLFVQTGNDTVEITAATVAAFRAQHDFVPDDLPAHLTTPPTYAEHVAPGKGFKVTEFPGEPMSLVHHTVSDDGSNAHLTMENAHALALYDATSTRGDVSSKVGEDKATINKRLGADYGIPGIDNLNFYAKPDGKKKATDPLQEALPLYGYLQFIVHAFDRCGLPKQYGERMMAMATTMADRKKLDLRALFMRVGMDESSFIRAVLAIDNRLTTSGATGLALDVTAREPFEKWWTTKSNDEPVPYLPDLSADGKPERTAAEDSLAGRPWVREGTTAPSGTTYSSLETAYTSHHAAAYLAAVNTWTAGQPPPL